MKHIVFKDRVKLYVRAGNGGNGIASFRREKFVPRGGPDGGDGGDGGHVILQCDANEDSLLPLYFEPHQRAKHAGHGMGAKCHGKNGAHKVVKVPCGTVITEDGTGDFMGELLEPGEELIIAQGGKGGIGNVHFKSSVNQAPRQFTEGTPGEEKVLWLELKLVADVGLVGYPNAGKSTLLSQLTDAHPKIAPYPFTTINPIIGTLIYENFNKLRIADIPGLIDGAHNGVGLGHEFLRHIERSKFLLFVIDMAGTDQRNPADDFLHLREELRLYREELSCTPYLVLANKMDDPASAAHIAEFKKKTGETAYEISAKEGTGLEPIKEFLYGHFFG